MNAQEVGKLLGISARAVYALAAPAGPISCVRIGRRIIFDQADVLQYQQSCRFTATKLAAASSLSSTAASAMINSGVPLYTVSAVLGHKSSVSTKRYAHLATETLRDAVGRIGQKIPHLGYEEPTGKTRANR